MFHCCCLLITSKTNRDFKEYGFRLSSHIRFGVCNARASFVATLEAFIHIFEFFVFFSQ